MVHRTVPRQSAASRQTAAQVNGLLEALLDGVNHGDMLNEPTIHKREAFMSVWAALPARQQTSFLVKLKKDAALQNNTKDALFAHPRIVLLEGIVKTTWPGRASRAPKQPSASRGTSPGTSSRASAELSIAQKKDADFTINAIKNRTDHGYLKTWALNRLWTPAQLTYIKKALTSLEHQYFRLYLKLPATLL